MVSFCDELIINIYFHNIFSDIDRVIVEMLDCPPIQKKSNLVLCVQPNAD